MTILVQGITCSPPPCSAGSRAAAASCVQPWNSSCFASRHDARTGVRQGRTRREQAVSSGLQRWGRYPSSGRVCMDLFAPSKRGRLQRAAAPAAKELLAAETRRPFTMRPLGRERGAISGKRTTRDPRQSPQTSRSASAAIIRKLTQPGHLSGSVKWFLYAKVNFQA